jgi:hypothetical protein
MKQEDKVKQNAALLDEIMESFIKTNRNQYVTFYEGKSVFSNSLDEALEIGDVEFGENSGFVVRKIRDKPIVFSNLVSV